MGQKRPGGALPDRGAYETQVDGTALNTATLLTQSPEASRTTTTAPTTTTTTGITTIVTTTTTTTGGAKRITLKKGMSVKK